MLNLNKCTNTKPEVKQRSSVRTLHSAQLSTGGELVNYGRPM